MADPLTGDTKKVAGTSKDDYWEYYRSLPESLRESDMQLQLLRCGHVVNDRNVYERAEYPFTVWEEITAGEGFVTVDNQSFPVRKGDIYVLPRGKYSRLEPNPRNPWQKKYFLLSGSLPVMLSCQFGFSRQFHFPGGAAVACGTFDILLRLYEQGHPDMHITAAEQLLKLLWHLRYPDTGYKKFSTAVRQAVRNIDLHFEKRPDLDAIAAEAGISRSHLQALFKKELGISPYEYHLQRKFEKAKELLLQSNLSIESIALRLAFRDRFHFSSEFKRRIGIPPGEFRKNGIDIPQKAESKYL